MKKQLILLLIVSLFIITISGTVSAADDSVTNTDGTNVLTTDTYALNETSTVESNSSGTSTDQISNSVSTTSQGDTNVADPIISGTVTHCGNGSAFEGVTITVNSMDDQLLATTTTNANGWYSVGFIDSGTVFKVTASYPGHISSTQEVTVTKNASYPTDPNYYGTADFRLGGNIYVDGVNGNDGNSGLSPTEAKKTITAAMSLVTDNDWTMYIAEAIYNEYGFTPLYNLVIIGDDRETTIIDGTGSTSGIFTINDGITLTLNALTLINGAATYGGAIYNTGTLYVSDCTFEGNTATYGGAIDNYQGSATVTDCTFTGNTATIHGGAIFNDSINPITSDLWVYTSDFIENIANYGGAINNGKNSCNAYISGCTFNSNTATNTNNLAEGGAIYNAGNLNLLSKGESSIFFGNTADYKGGAISNKYFTTIDGNTDDYSLFTFNSAIWGGAIFTDYETLDLSYCTFEYNTATYGGAIYQSTHTGQSGQAGITNINNCIFTSNTATIHGGAIYNDGSSTATPETETQLTVTDSTFTGNTASYGGAINNGKHSSTTTINGCAFNSNTATKTNNLAEGGAIYNAGTLNIYDSENSETTFTRNTANYKGGAISNKYFTNIYTSYGTYTPNGIIFNGNSATWGGAIFTDYETLDLSYCTFNSNNATYGGAVCQSINTGIINIDNCIFTGNTATIHGGAIYNDGSSTATPETETQLTVTDSTFTGNNAAYGGAINNGKHSSTTTISNCAFNSNTATKTNNLAEGGAIYNAGTLNILEGITTFTSNTANYKGGAISNKWYATITSPDGTIFTANTATYGGAIFNDYQPLEVTNGAFTSNSATYGGAIYNAGTHAGITEVTSSTFTSNTATNGGAIYNEIGGTTTVDDVYFKRNTAKNGGAINNAGTLTVNDSVNPCTFERNNAIYGGAIYNSGTATINNPNYINNAARYGKNVYP